MAKKWSETAKRKWQQEQDKKVKAMTAELERGIQDVFTSSRFQEYLDMVSKFYDYSFSNTLMILLQKPHATRIAGAKKWQDDFGRKVTPDQRNHPIYIFAPSKYKMAMDREKIDPITRKPVIGRDGKPVMESILVEKMYFRLVKVYDASQTEGEPLKTLAVELKDSVENFEFLFSELKNLSPVPMDFENIQGSAKGYFSPSDMRIALQCGMSESQTIKTCVHEIAHAIIHSAPESGDKTRRTQEVEAEGIAYVVCKHLGIDTSDYSFGYIATWSGSRELPELKASLGVIQESAAQIIGGLQDKFRERAVRHGEIPTAVPKRDSNHHPKKNRAAR